MEFKLVMAKCAPAVLLAAAAVLFIGGIGRYDLWHPDEPRYGEIAREMIQSGDPVTLRVNGEYYGEKPPLLFWLIAAASLPGTDEVTSFTARFPSVVAAIWTIWLTYLLARRLFDRWTALWAGVVLATSVFFWWEARNVRTDMLLTAFTTTALYALWRWREEHRVSWLVAVYTAIAAALLVKGPPGLVFPLLFIAVFFWKERAERRRLHWVLGVAVAVVPVALWYALASQGAPAQVASASEAGTSANLFQQTVGRFFLGVSKSQPPWYHLLTLPGGLLPWSLFLPWTLFWTWRHRHDGPSMRLLLAWTIPAFVFFSLSAGKRAVYLLPLYPVLAILISRSLTEPSETEHLKCRKTGLALWACFAALVAAALVGILSTKHAVGFHWTAKLIALPPFVFALDSAWRAWRTNGKNFHALVAAESAILLVIAGCIALPSINSFRSIREYTAPLQALSRSGLDYRIYSLGFTRVEYVFYAEHLIEPVELDAPGNRTSQEKDDAPAEEFQARVKANIVNAAADVPVEDWNALKPDEAIRLQAAVETATQDTGPESAQVLSVKEALASAVSRFAAEFTAESPAYLFVREEDWRWILGFNPAMQALHVDARQTLGSRTVLRVANERGAKLLSP